ncbi:AAA family ATPase [Streptomyces sp. NPDC057257]|uniref:AAA family ATPase n=1 Tax=Streptomyces sp. NPDC057257 TaxID=3346071 RepID=UPI0036434EB3
MKLNGEGSQRPSGGPESAPASEETPEAASGQQAPADGLLAAALALAAQGVKVFPCHGISEDGACTCGQYNACKSPGKHPRTGPGVKNGSKDATTDPEKIKLWWTMWHRSGLNFGQTLAGRAVVDIDVAGGKPGEATWAALSDGQSVPDTLTYRTGRAGTQYVFTLPEGEMGGKANGYGNTLAEAVDFKTGPNAYVMVPGSRTDDVYTVLRDTGSVPLPGWIATVARTTEPTTITRADGSKVRVGGYNFWGMSAYNLMALLPDDPRRGNDWLTALAGHLTHMHPDRLDLVRITCEMTNRESTEPMTKAEVDKVLASVERMEAAKELDDAATSPDEDAVQALMDRLIDSAGLDEIEDPEPLIDGVLTLDTLSRINGEPASGKSLVALDWAGCVGTGIPWRGHEVRQAPVVYIIAEGVKGFKKRKKAWELHHRRKMTGVLFLPEPLQVNGPEWATYTEVCKRLGARFIVLDTQRRVTTGVKENDNTEFGEVVERLENLRRATGACVKLVHHTPKGGEGGSGAGAVTGAMNSEFLMIKRKQKGGGRVYILENSKEKDEAEGMKKTFELRVYQVGVKPNGEPQTSVVLLEIDADPGDPGTGEILPELDEKAADSLKALWEVIRKVWKGADSIRKGEVKSVAVPDVLSKSAFYRAWEELEDKGLVRPVPLKNGDPSKTDFEVATKRGPEDPDTLFDPRP